MKKKLNPLIATRSIHGIKFGPRRGPVSMPIYQTSNFRFEDSRDAIKYANGDDSVYIYTRYKNPTIEDTEQKLAAIANCDNSILFASGMAAITTTIHTFANSGDEILALNSLYGGTYRYFRDHLNKMKIDVKYFSNSDLMELGNKISKKTKIIYFESPTNPTLSLVDIEVLINIVRIQEKKLKIKIITIIDNTFGTFVNQNPLKLGVDIVVESATKFLGGHSDLLAGVVFGNSKLISKIKLKSKYFGGTADPFMAFLLGRSLSTFELRVERCNSNALKLAEILSKNKKVEKVIYPFLNSHPDYAIAKKQMKAGGGVVTIVVKGGVKNAVKFVDSLNIAINAMSLGGVETLVSISVYSTHINLTDEELNEHGVTGGMVRISVGVENIDDLINDFNQSLKKLK
ncbi:MAG: PLP-dependent aspartate aminotransferase family protein [Bacteroidetes bacterium]|nr:PLP-dependent aspartate aminotransferase family protein [Bacteroidota bacterium]